MKLDEAAGISTIFLLGLGLAGATLWRFGRKRRAGQ